MECVYKFLLLTVLPIVLLVTIDKAESQTYTVGVEQVKYFPQYSYEGQQYLGYSRDLLDAFSQWAGVKFEYRILPVSRLFTTFLELQTLDFKYPDNPYWNSERKSTMQIYYSDSITEYIDGVVVRSKYKGRGLAKFKKLGTIRDYTAFEYNSMIADGSVKLYETDTFIGLLEMVLSNRIDGAYINIAVAKYNLESQLNQPNALIFDESLPHTKSSYYLSTIKHPDVIEKMNEFLKKEEELVRSLQEKYNIRVYWNDHAKSKK